MVKNEQFESYNKTKQLATEENSNSTMIQMDFEEYFTYLYQDEVDSAHCKTNSVTRFTVMIWFQKESIPMVIVSDNNHHNKRKIIPYSFTVFNYVKEMFRENIQNINTWTDGALVDSKISLCLAKLVTTLPQLFPHYQVTWNYSARSHEKGAVDTAQKMKFSIKDFFSKRDQIRSFLWIWSHLMKKSLMENFIFLCCR